MRDPHALTLTKSNYWKLMCKLDIEFDPHRLFLYIIPLPTIVWPKSTSASPFSPNWRIRSSSSTVKYKKHLQGGPNHFKDDSIIALAFVESGFESQLLDPLCSRCMVRYNFLLIGWVHFVGYCTQACLSPT